MSGELRQPAASPIGRRGAFWRKTTGAEQESISWAPGSLILCSHNGQSVRRLKIKRVVPISRVKELVHLLAE